MKTNDDPDSAKEPGDPPRESWWTPERIKAIGWSVAIILAVILGRRLF